MTTTTFIGGAILVLIYGLFSVCTVAALAACAISGRLTREEEHQNETQHLL
jgi:hypothetical protein